MGSVKEDIDVVLACCASNLKAETTREEKRNCLNAHTAQIISLVCKRIEGVENGFSKEHTDEGYCPGCHYLGFETARQAILDVIKEE